MKKAIVGKIRDDWKKRYERGKAAAAKKPMGGDPEPDSLDYQDRRGRVRDAKPGELPPKITPQQKDRLGRE